ncbi:MAG: HAMP domain-containing protein [Candidatus Nanopelagicales bacterium]
MNEHQGRPRTTQSEDDEASGAADQDFSALPSWRRPRRLSRQLATALVLTALLAVATFGGLNYVAARELLVRGTQQQLVAVGATRAVGVEAGAERLVAEISVASSDPFIAEALGGFSQAFAELGAQALTPEQRAELEAEYQQRVVGPLDAAGLGPFEAQALVPRTRAGRWLQYHYTLRPPGTPAPADADDGTAYSELNSELTDTLREFSASVGGGDVLLIDDTGTIVYSLEKRNDVGTNLVSGPYANSALAQVVTDRLPVTRVGTTLLTDFTVTPTGRASLYAVSSVPDATQVIGALAVEIPVAAINRLTTGPGGGETIGLDEADSYIVASDMQLQSEPRAWIEDPDGYLEQLRSGDEQDQTEAQLIELFGSPVGVQLIDTRPVESAIDGEDFQGTAKNYFGEATFAASESFNASDRRWVVVTEVPRSAALAPLAAYVMRIMLVLAIVLPVVAGFGIWLARSLTRPIRPTVEAAAAIVDGDRHPTVDSSRSDEFGDLGRRLRAMAASLGAHEAELADEYERTRQLLLAVLPPNLVDEDGEVVGTGEAAAQATVVAVVLVPSDEHQDLEQAGEGFRGAAQLAERVATETGLERVRMAADRFLFLAGMDHDDAGADAAVGFAAQFRSRLDTEAADSFELHVGLSSGAVATGLLDTGSLTFGAWGEPVRRALALASLSQVDVVLVDASTARACTDRRWRFEPAHDVVDLDGQLMDLYRLDDEDGMPAHP